MSLSLLISIPERIDASGIFGVITSAISKSRAFRVSTASSFRSFDPLVDTITGSTTIFLALYSLSFSDMTTMRSAEDTIPILTESGYISVNTLSSWAERKAGSTSSTADTPNVF